MAIEIQSQTVHPNDIASFRFSDTVQSFVVGVSYFSLTYGSNDHHVQTTNLHLTPDKPSATQVDVAAHAQLKDDSGHKLKTSESLIGVVCIAVVGTADPMTVLANKAGIPSNTQSSPIQLPNGNPTVLQSISTGYELSYGSKDHHVEAMKATSGVVLDGSQASLTGTAEMFDRSGNEAENPKVDVGLISSANSSPGFTIKSARLQTSSTHDVDFGAPVKAAAVLISDWNVAYESSKDHHVKTYGAGTTGWTISGSKVQLANARAFIKDDSGNHQNGGSAVTILTIAVL